MFFCGLKCLANHRVQMIRRDPWFVDDVNVEAVVLVLVKSLVFVQMSVHFLDELIGQYRRGPSVDPVMSQVVSQNGGTRLDGSIGFGETQGNSETPGEVRRTSGEYG
jgi:hypothetical protein